MSLTVFALGLFAFATGVLAGLIRLIGKKGMTLTRSGQLVAGGVILVAIAVGVEADAEKSKSVAAMTTKVGNTGAQDNKAVLADATQVEVAAAPARKFVEYLPIVRTFRESTALQQGKWNERNEGRYWVRGKGRVFEVGETNIFSGMDGDYYEITVDVTDDTRAALFYPKTEANERLVNLKKGQRIEFKGNLKKLVDLGFWISGDILVE